MTMRSEIKVLRLQAKEHHGWSAKHPKQEEARKDLTLTGFRGSTALLPWFWTASLQNCETLNSCCFKPPSLYSFYGYTRKHSASFFNSYFKISYSICYSSVSPFLLNFFLGESYANILLLPSSYTATAHQTLYSNPIVPKVTMCFILYATCAMTRSWSKKLHW